MNSIDDMTHLTTAAEILPSLHNALRAEFLSSAHSDSPENAEKTAHSSRIPFQTSHFHKNHPLKNNSKTIKNGSKLIENEAKLIRSIRMLITPTPNSGCSESRFLISYLLTGLDGISISVTRDTYVFSRVVRFAFSSHCRHSRSTAAPAQHTLRRFRWPNHDLSGRDLRAEFFHDR